MGIHIKRVDRENLKKLRAVRKQYEENFERLLLCGNEIELHRKLIAIEKELNFKERSIMKKLINFGFKVFDPCPATRNYSCDQCTGLYKKNPKRGKKYIMTKRTGKNVIECNYKKHCISEERILEQLEALSRVKLFISYKLS